MTRIAVVLGAALRADGSPSPALQRRVDQALRLWHAGQLDMILGCGGVPRAGRTEAAAIREICLTAGVPDAAILCDHASANTYQNLQNAAAMMPAGATITVVTDGYHSLRARLIARELGLTVRVSAAPRPAAPLAHHLRTYGRELASLGLHGAIRLFRLIKRPPISRR